MSAHLAPTLERVNGHCYRLGIYVITHHRMVPASWVVTRDGHHVSEHVTLLAAVDSLGGTA